MKKVRVNGTLMNIPESFITSAYSGACAAHQVDVNEKLFKKDKQAGKSKLNFKKGDKMKIYDQYDTKS